MMLYNAITDLMRVVQPTQQSNLLLANSLQMLCPRPGKDFMSLQGDSFIAKRKYFEIDAA